MTTHTLQLNGFTFSELFHAEALQQLDEQFLQALAVEDKTLHSDLLNYRQGVEMAPKQVSHLILHCGPVLETFLAALFSIESEVASLNQQILSHDPIFAFKTVYVQKHARRRLQDADLESFAELDAWLNQKIDAEDKELAIAKYGVSILEKDEKDSIEKLIQWCVWVLRANHTDWISFKLPKKLDYEALVDLAPDLRQRDGFALTDPRASQREVMNEIHYCVYCHKNEGDFCSKGFPVKKNEPEKGLKVNPLGEYMTGCPLEEKISEMHTLKKQGYSLASLATIMIDNPMCAVTGHRICNDCMKGCIYQKQDPVDIPQVETRVLTDVLDLPWGVEIYDLLMRWNPLRQQQWAAKPYNGLKTLVMGMGPAGFTLAHHLLMEGFAVVGVDGLKIEPLSQALISKPIRHFESIKENLNDRVTTGFGGVAEYGITVRWDKNFLKLIYISLMRRPYFQVFGGVRFGGTITVEDAWTLGFDHLAIAVGAGLPRELPIPGSMAPGMRQANDFLMALQLTGAAKRTSLANLQLRLPAVVIGGGLTGVDAATEAQAYYIKQVEKALQRYETLVKHLGEARVRSQFADVEFEILNEFVTHGREVKQEREIAQKENREPDFIKLLHKWGGVSVVYRRRIQDSPAYRRNHDEINKALEEGIFYQQGLQPAAARLDKFGHVEALVCESADKNEQVVPARSILVATGAKPNIAYEFEHRGTFHREGMEYKTYKLENNELEILHPDSHVKVEQFGPFTSYNKDGHYVTFLGDTHPVFHGSVVKAISSGKRTYPKIVSAMGSRALDLGDEKEYRSFSNKISELFSASVLKIKRHTPSVIELTVKAPIAAKNFKPGQFYRVQNFETYAKKIDDTVLQSEAIAMLASRVDKEAGTLAFMVLEQGASSRLFAALKAGDSISVMGPTGVRAKIPEDKETVMVIGGRMGAAHIHAVGPAMRAGGNRVLYVAGFRTKDEVYSQQELEQAADSILWITESGEPVDTHRTQDLSATGDFMEVLLNHAQKLDVPLKDVDRILVVGTSRLVHLVKNALSGEFSRLLEKNPKVVASIYGPMQCMLKGVCAQCLQWQIDPATGQRTKAVYTCSWHDQPLEIVDLHNLDERLAQNRTQEILSNLWLDHLFEKYEVERV